MSPKPIRPVFQTVELLAWFRRFHAWSIIRLILLSWRERAKKKWTAKEVGLGWQSSQGEDHLEVDFLQRLPPHGLRLGGWVVEARKTGPFQDHPGPFLGLTIANSVKFDSLVTMAFW
jgi:hypothetical protein